MSKLVWTNLSFDAIRDVDSETSSTGSVNFHDTEIRTRTPGNVNGTPVNMPGGAYTDNAFDAKGTDHGDGTASRVNTDQASLRDFANTYRMTTGTDKTNSVSYTSFKGSASTTQTWRGWGTSGAWQAATNNTHTGSTGSFFDGDNTYTTSAYPLSSSNGRPGGGYWDGNKWLSGIITSYYSTGLSAARTLSLVFEGSGAQTTDTDFSHFYIKTLGDYAMGASTTVYNGTPISLPASFNYSAYHMERGTTDVTRQPTISTSYNRVVVKWAFTNGGVFAANQEYAVSFG